MTRRRFSRVFFCFLVVIVIAPRAWSQTPSVDPQSLIGQWSGTWINSHTGKGSGKYYLTIERVDGEKVFGKGEFSGRRTSEFKVNGTLSGNRLTFGKTELTVDGNEMRGTGPNTQIMLMKEK